MHKNFTTTGQYTLCILYFANVEYKTKGREDTYFTHLYPQTHCMGDPMGPVNSMVVFFYRKNTNKHPGQSHFAIQDAYCNFSISIGIGWAELFPLLTVFSLFSTLQSHVSYCSEETDITSRLLEDSTACQIWLQCTSSIVCLIQCRQTTVSEAIVLQNK